MSGVGGGKRQGPPLVSSSFRAHTAGHICSKPGSCSLSLSLSLLSSRRESLLENLRFPTTPSQPTTSPLPSPLKVSQQAVAVPRVPSPLLERRIDRLLSSPLRSSSRAPREERLTRCSAEGKRRMERKRVYYRGRLSGGGRRRRKEGRKDGRMDGGERERG